ncbi:hypothetical protein SELMODRAFT_440561 [Selaginella moellendorffii]|uniref:Uncharacterized protein n=1 Tax=Selaginella moellendorffii TaxID=88036 RepID=D8RCI3_SELML|nr:uncharacterized protein LOC9650955 [Selaginella moellendorffii]EFJ29858.1 hypothetical protein SELMODRAFT_440561 [Selaginella moellendorffii]|eukprot:XP_002968742.1 uncharacterized protein LOC9650955 [Selaginella moellendorffii]
MERLVARCKSISAAEKKLFGRSKRKKKEELQKQLDDIQKILERIEALMKASCSSSSVTTAANPPPPANPPPVKPPHGALKLLQFVGTCSDKGVALFIGTPPSTPALSPQPTCIVVGYKETMVWKEGEEVTVTISGQTMKGEVVSLFRRMPWVAAVELFKPLELPPKVPLMVGLPRNEEVVFVRRAGEVELPAIVKEHYLPDEVAGIVPGVQMGDVIVEWDSDSRSMRVSGIVVKTEEDGAVVGLPVDDATLFFIEADKKSWYRTKYPGRLLAVPKYG